MHQANSLARTVYPDNPRGYFDDGDESPWQLETHDAGSIAALAAVDGRPRAIRVDISSARIRTPWFIQVTAPGLSLVEGEQYELRFLARADSPRPIAFGVSMAHEPWKGLGFHKEVTIGTNWQEFTETVLPDASDANARVYFQVGADPTSLALDRVQLRHLPSGRFVTPPIVASEHVVSYRFNSVGCRGPDYPGAKTDRRRRILVLGGASTLGIGVHESDTFAARLERLLNSQPFGADDERYEVINCGVNGQGMRDRRITYEKAASAYQPDVVLLTLNVDDDMSWHEAVDRGYAHQSGPYERFFLTFELLQTMSRGRRTPDYSGLAKDLVDLATMCRSNGMALSLVVFRTEPMTPNWTGLMEAVSSAARGTDIPVLDVGPTLLEMHGMDTLRVHRADQNPNEIAHRLAAEALESFLRDEKHP
jgi:hypothetical protein